LPACAAITPEASDAIIARTGVTHAKAIEAGIAFVLLHELGHVVNGDTTRTFNSLADARQQELRADNFAINAAIAAREPLMGSMTPFFLTVVNGGNISTEQSSDHPLGVRRALNFYVRMRAGYLQSAAIKSKFSPEVWDHIIGQSDRIIVRLQKCVQQIDSGLSAATCS
jgi:hypothetical protein